MLYLDTWNLFQLLKTQRKRSRRQSTLYNNSSKALNILWEMTNKPWSRVPFDFIGDKLIEFSKDFLRKGS